MDHLKVQWKKIIILPSDCIIRIPFVWHNSLRGLEAPFRAVHVADVRSHSAGNALEGLQEVTRKKKIGPRRQWQMSWPNFGEGLNYGNHRKCCRRLGEKMAATDRTCEKCSRDSHKYVMGRLGSKREGHPAARVSQMGQREARVSQMHNVFTSCTSVVLIYLWQRTSSSPQFLSIRTWAPFYVWGVPRSP